MSEQQKTKREIVRIGSHLSELVTVFDSAGNLLHKMVRPIMIEFYFRDVVQVIVGATILAIPVSFTEEVWRLGAELPNKNILALSAISILFISLFVYYNFYKGHLKTHWIEFLKRGISIYVLAMLVALMMLFIIDKAPLGTDWLITLKRMVVIAFPASLSAAVADMIK